MAELNITCKQGKLQIEQGQVRIVKPFTRQVVWSCAVSDLLNVTCQKRTVLLVCTTYDAIFETRSGKFEASQMTYETFQKIQAALPQGIATNEHRAPRVWKPKPRHWYQDQTINVHIATYTNEKQMQKEVQEAGKFGWIPQGTAATAGHINVGRTAMRVATFGTSALLFGASRSKDKMTITYVRQR